MLGGYSLTSFGPDQAAAFKLGASRALGTNVSVVGVTSGAVPSVRRKMLQAAGESLNVTISVQTPYARADVMAASMRTAITPAAMQAAGLVRCMRVELVGAPRQMAFPLADVASSLAEPSAAPAEEQSDSKYAKAVAAGVGATLSILLVAWLIHVFYLKRQAQDAAHIRDLWHSLERANSYPVPAAPAAQPVRAAGLCAEATRAETW